MAPRRPGSFYPGRVIRFSRESMQSAARVGGLAFVVALAALRPAAGRDPVLAPVRDPRRDRVRVRRPRPSRASTRSAEPTGVATAPGRRRCRPRLGRGGGRGRRAGAGARAAARPAQHALPSRPRRRRRAWGCSPTPTVSTATPAGRRFLRPSGSRRATIHVRSGPHRGSTGDGRAATTATPSRASARTQPASRSSRARSPTSSRRSAGRCTGSPSSTEVGTRDDAAFAITVLAHEATHLRGVRDEAETECYALQEGAPSAERLGLDAAAARALMRGAARP